MLTSYCRFVVESLSTSYRIFDWLSNYCRIVHLLSNSCRIFDELLKFWLNIFEILSNCRIFVELSSICWVFIEWVPIFCRIVVELLSNSVELLSDFCRIYVDLWIIVEFLSNYWFHVELLSDFRRIVQFMSSCCRTFVKLTIFWRIDYDIISFKG